jgi:hypothetical protein
MADAINNVAPRDQESQCSGHNVSAPSANDATITSGATAPQSDLAQQQDHDTLNNNNNVASQAPSTSVNRPKFTPDDFDIAAAYEREVSRQELLQQLLTDTIEPDLDLQLEKLALRWSMPVKQIIQLAASLPNVVSSELAVAANKRRIHERTAFRHCLALKDFAGSSVVESVLLPTRGPAAVYLASNKGLVYGDELGRSKPLCKSMDIASLIKSLLGDLRLVIQYHKHTTGEGGSQDYSYDDMVDFVSAVRTHGVSLAFANRMMASTGTIVPAGSTIPVFFVAVVDGSFWTKDRVKVLRQKGKESKKISSGGLYVRSTAELDEFFESVARA